MFRVTMDALVAGNPSKAWKVKLPDGELREGDEFAPDRELPDDEWETQSHDFDDLDAAKDFVRGLPEASTTHVRIYDDDGALVFDQDADADALDEAAAGVPPRHLVDSPLPFVDDQIEEAPAVLPRQEAP